MSKAAVTRIFIGAIVAVAAGVVMTLAAVLVAIAGGTFTLGGPEILKIEGSGFAWTLVLLIIGGLAITGGTFAALISWIGALLNTAQLEDRTWFVLLLILGVFSFGFVAMVAYVLAGPDGTKEVAPRSGITTAARV